MTPRFELQGHRGARGLFAENTLFGIAGALAIGVDTVEIDVGMTSDGVVVVSHDPVLNPDLTRGPGGDWLGGPGPAIWSMTLAELRDFDVGRIRPGSAYAARFADQVGCDGAVVPTLAEVLALDASVGVNIEMKLLADRRGLTAPPPVMARAVLAEVARAGAAARVTVQSFDWRGVRLARAAGVALSWLTEPATVAASGLWWDAGLAGSVPRAVAAEGGGTWAPEFAALTRAEVIEAQGLGLRVVPWTVNGADDIARLIGWGVDGVITDRPDVARGAMAAAGLALPPARGAGVTAR